MKAAAKVLAQRSEKSRRIKRMGDGEEREIGGNQWLKGGEKLTGLGRKFSAFCLNVL
jgi:hypothetical protein